jgi:hypothetical protein
LGVKDADDQKAAKDEKSPNPEVACLERLSQIIGMLSENH